MAGIFEGIRWAHLTMWERQRKRVPTLLVLSSKRRGEVAATPLRQAEGRPILRGRMFGHTVVLPPGQARWRLPGSQHL